MHTYTYVEKTTLIHYIIFCLVRSDRNNNLLSLIIMSLVKLESHATTFITDKVSVLINVRS